jgi:hypothetical protein
MVNILFPKLDLLGNIGINSTLALGVVFANDGVRWTPKFGPVAERSEFRVGAGLEQQPRHPNTQ